MTRAPRAFATRTPAAPIGPRPKTATESMPDTFSLAWVLYWVPIMSVDRAATSKDISSGIGRQFSVGTTMSSASPPSMSKPMHFHDGQSIR